MTTLTSTQKKLLIVSSVLLASLIITEILMSNYLFEKSNEFAIAVQQVNLTIPCLIFSLGVMTMMIGLYIMYGIFVSHDKVILLHDQLFILINFIITICLKMLYYQKRPYMVENGPRVQDQDFDFGMPSQHSYFCAVISVLIFDKLFVQKNHFSYRNETSDEGPFLNIDNQAKFKPKDEEEEKQLNDQEDENEKNNDKEQEDIDLNENPAPLIKNPTEVVQQNTSDGLTEYKFNISLIIETQPLSNWYKILTIFVMGLVSLCMMFSRVYLGVHSIPQLVLGFGYGFVISLVLIFYAREFLVISCIQILKNDYYNGSMRTKFMTYQMVWLFTTNLILVSLWYYSNYMTRDLQPIQKKYMIKAIQESHMSIPKPADTFQDFQLCCGALNCIIFGLLFVLVYFKRAGYCINKSFWGQQSWKVFISRFIIFVIVAPIPLAICKMIGHFCMTKVFFFLLTKSQLYGFR